MFSQLMDRIYPLHFRFRFRKMQLQERFLCNSKVLLKDCSQYYCALRKVVLSIRKCNKEIESVPSSQHLYLSESITLSCNSKDYFYFISLFLYLVSYQWIFTLNIIILLSFQSLGNFMRHTCKPLKVCTKLYPSPDNEFQN